MNTADTERVLWLVCFDVAKSARRRRALVKLLLSFGDRVQRSAFECWLLHSELAVLQRKVGALIRADQDRVGYWRLPKPWRVWVPEQAPTSGATACAAPRYRVA